MSPWVRDSTAIESVGARGSEPKALFADVIIDLDHTRKATVLVSPPLPFRSVAMSLVRDAPKRNAYDNGRPRPQGGRRGYRVTGLLGLAVTILALFSRPYRELSTRYISEPEPALTS